MISKFVQVVQQEQSQELRGFIWFISEVHFLACSDMRHAKVVCSSPFPSLFLSLFSSSM